MCAEDDPCWATWVPEPRRGHQSRPAVPVLFLTCLSVSVFVDDCLAIAFCAPPQQMGFRRPGKTDRIRHVTIPKWLFPHRQRAVFTATAVVNFTSTRTTSVERDFRFCLSFRLTNLVRGPESASSSHPAHNTVRRSTRRDHAHGVRHTSTGSTAGTEREQYIPH